MRVDEVVTMATDDGPPLRVSIEDIVASGRRVQRRRRRAGLAAGVAMAAVAAVAVTTALVPTRNRPEQESAAVAASSSPVVTRAAATGPLLADPLEFTFAGYSVGPVHVQDPIVAGNAYQIAAVTVDGTTDGRHPGKLTERRTAKPRLDATLTLYRPGAYAVQRLTGAVSTTIAGHRALSAEHHQSPGPWFKTLAWEYAPNAWAVLDSSADRADLPTMRQLEATVAKLTGAPARPVTVPFTMGYVPAGYDVFVVGDHMTGSLDAVGGPSPNQYSGLFFAKSGLPRAGLLDDRFQGVSGHTRSGIVGPAGRCASCARSRRSGPGRVAGLGR